MVRVRAMRSHSVVEDAVFADGVDRWPGRIAGRRVLGIERVVGGGRRRGTLREALPVTQFLHVRTCHFNRAAPFFDNLRAVTQNIIS